MKIFSVLNVLLFGSKLASDVAAQVSWINSSTYELPETEINEILEVTNHLRDTIEPPPVNMSLMVYNATFAAEVIPFLNARPADWVFQNKTDRTDTLTIPSSNWNGITMLQLPEFSKWAPYCTFWVHDTNDAHQQTQDGKKIVGPDAVLNIFKFRLKQLHCFDWSACLKHPELTNFLSCIVPLSETKNKGACSYSNDFLVHMLLNYDSMIVVGINHKGPYTPRPQQQLLSFWGWACASTGIKNIPTNGYPYVAGKERASECDAEHPIAVKGLCTKGTGRARQRMLRNVPA